MIRTFPRTSIVHDGHVQSGYRIHCRVCQAEGKVVITNTKGLPPDVTAKKFKQLGWEVGKNDNRDICPKCVEKNRGVVPIKKDLPMIAEQPKPMSREDRRLIFGKIDDVYLDERRGYEDGWSDKRIADELGCPLAWVKAVRDENFGPEGLSEASREAVAQIKELSASVKRVEGIIADAQKQLSELKAATMRADKIATGLERLYGAA